MNIIILGAGRVGESVAESLVSERNDITVIDTNPQRLRALQDRLDLRGVVGNGIQPSVLQEAGAQDADMMIACAPLDETNLVACKIAHDVFNIPTTIARLRSPEFPDGSPLMDKSGFAVDRVICPEASVTRYVRQLIAYPEALQVLEFAQGLVSLIAVRAVAGAPLVRHTISELPSLVPEADMRIVSIYRPDPEGPDQAIVCDGVTRIEPGDEVFVLAATKHIRTVLEALRRRDRPVKRVMIAGGGRVGLRLARELKGEYRVKIIEHDAKRCEYLASQLPADTLILHGDSTDEELLEGENVHDMDLFLGLTSDDEDNIMACLLAKRMGAKRVLALINRKAYADLMQGSQIDIALSPAQTVIGELLAYVRRGDVEAVHSLRRGAAEALEAVVRGDAKTSKVVGRPIGELKLPPGAQIGAIVRGLPEGEMDDEARERALRQAQVIIAHHDTVIQANDHVIVFLPRKRMVREVEKLLQVSATFF
ncbi:MULTISPECIES: Trk system potassium transporter TrkA [Caldimonas]|uniref:Trk system potassium transporter TrkA n=1 Tax=Caldimonas TaxID=196013 RepID=UPI000370550B|nr:MULTISPECIES: Trk system potassium transporter TrkA [Caldimonas]MCX7660696.1 Trk system potassium transporter TrkA [Caldimonas manganoxidans]GIX23025.1 MAG: Trk system potassium transport protein TrkA [Caldimonas sp.]